MNLIKVDNETEVIRELQSLIQTISNKAIENNGRFFVGLSGGSVVKFLNAALANIKTDWSKWMLAFCDERVVPENSSDSTFGAYKRELLPNIKELNEKQFITIKQGVNADEAAKDYTEKLKQAFESDVFKFDLLLLGMGPDGHTCSLFPGHRLLDCMDLSVAAIKDSPKPPPERVTLTFKVINEAENCVFAISGSGKADILKRILVDKEDLPARRVKPRSNNLYWIVDKQSM